MRGFHTKSPNFIKFSEATLSHLWSSFLHPRPGKHNDSVVLSTPLPFYLFSMPLLQFVPLLFFPPLKPCLFVLMYKTFQILLLLMPCPLLKVNVPFLCINDMPPQHLFLYSPEHIKYCSAQTLLRPQTSATQKKEECRKLYVFPLTYN